jgi:hypothetical protein
MKLSRSSLNGLKGRKWTAMFVLASMAASSHAVTVYQNDFESGLAPEFSPAIITTAPNNSTKFLGRFSGDSPSTTLNLSGLDPHTQVTLSFDLYIIHSWDGTGSAGFGPDILRFTSGSTTLLDASFSQRGGATQSYSDATPLGGGPFPEKTDADAENTLGYGDNFGTNTVYNLTFTFAHTDANLAVLFNSIGLQGVGDESWGLDNMVVSTNSVVPEPASLAALAFGAAALIRRRRKK